jgi:hypothetical protein
LGAMAKLTSGNNAVNAGLNLDCGINALSILDTNSLTFGGASNISSIGVTTSKGDIFAGALGATFFNSAYEDYQTINILSGTANINISLSNKLKITIGDSGILNLFDGFLKEIDISKGGQFNYISKDRVEYRVDAIENIKLNSSQLVNLMEVSDLIHEKYLKDQVLGCQDISVLRGYTKLCVELGKNQVKSIIKSRKENIIDINLTLKGVESLDEIFVDAKKLPSSVLDSMISSIFPGVEEKNIDFNYIDNFIYRNYFEIAGVAKDPLSGFDQKLVLDVVGEIASFLEFGDI